MAIAEFGADPSGERNDDVAAGEYSDDEGIDNDDGKVGNTESNPGDMHMEDASGTRAQSAKPDAPIGMALPQVST